MYLYLLPLEFHPDVTKVLTEWWGACQTLLHHKSKKNTGSFVKINLFKTGY